MISSGIIVLGYLAIGLLVTIFVIGDKTFPAGTTPYEKAGGIVFMIVLWPIVICVRHPGDM
jgi:hypothetical protein